MNNHQQRKWEMHGLLHVSESDECELTEKSAGHVLVRQAPITYCMPPRQVCCWLVTCYRFRAWHICPALSSLVHGQGSTQELISLIIVLEREPDRDYQRLITIFMGLVILSSPGKPLVESNIESLTCNSVVLPVSRNSVALIFWNSVSGIVSYSV